MELEIIGYEKMEMSNGTWIVVKLYQNPNGERPLKKLAIKNLTEEQADDYIAQNTDPI